MSSLPQPVRELVQAFCRLPGVGEKTALRFALHLVLDKPASLGELGRALERASEQLGPCSRCGNLALRGEGPALCSICADSGRDATVLCVVGRIPDLLAIERSGAMRGRYFVLGRLLSPLEGIGPDDLPLEALRQTIDANGVKELVLATPASVEGEATALHLARQFGGATKVTRIASGIPHGGELEFADAITLGRAFSGRRGLGD